MRWYPTIQSKKRKARRTSRRSLRRQRQLDREARERALRAAGVKNSITYQQYLETAHWKHLRYQRLVVAGFRCEDCNRKPESGVLQVHHLRYRNWFDVLVSDLRALCARCHSIRHNKLSEYESSLKAQPTTFNRAASRPSWAKASLTDRNTGEVRHEVKQTSAILTKAPGTESWEAHQQVATSAV